MTSYLRKRVSQNRNRLIEGKYDLDLTYVSKNLIAMGYPSDKTFQKFIRNQIEKVSKFLNEKHENSFKIFNLCDETDYDISHFNHMVEIVPIKDHCPPKFYQIRQFCEKLDEWLKSSNQNVGIVHCKAGKGRTGTMVACYFIHSQMFSNPFDAINEFNCRRCNDSKGITIPSQLRYIEYYADFINKKRVYQETELFLKSFRIDGLSQKSDELSKICFLKIIGIANKQELFYSETLRMNTNRAYTFEIKTPVRLVDDVLFCFLSKTKKIIKVYMNTFCFLQDNEYAQNEAQSYLGKKTFKQTIDVDPNSNTSAATITLEKRTVQWELKKKHLDLANKNENFQPEFTITFEFEIGKISESDFMQRQDELGEETEEEKVIFKLGNGREAHENDSISSNESVNKVVATKPPQPVSKNMSFIRDLFGKSKKVPKRSKSEPTCNLNALETSLSDPKLLLAVDRRKVTSHLPEQSKSQQFSHDYSSDTTANSLSTKSNTSGGRKNDQLVKPSYKTKFKKLFS